MAWKAEAEVRALQRMVALLLSFAGLAERAGVASFPVRFIVLAILRHAETIVWAFVAEAAGASLVRRTGGRPRCVARTGALVPADEGCAEASRLVISFRTLARIVTVWARRRLAPAAPSRILFLSHACPHRGWQDAAALRAPDTS